MPLSNSTGLRWTATPVDLVSGWNAELRDVAAVYALSDGKEMTLDRFDLR